MKGLGRMFTIAAVSVFAVSIIPFNARLSTRADTASSSVDSSQVSSESSVSSDTSPAVEIPDNYLKAALVAQGVDNNGDGVITQHEMLYNTDGTARTTLYLDNSGITDLTGLQYATNLVTLNVQDTKITTLPTAVLNQLTNLSELNLSFNKIAALPSGADKLTLPKLSYLWLNSNKITSLPAGAFSGVPEAQYIYLKSNGIKTIDPAAFSGLTNIFDIDLETNSISSVTPAMFSSLTTLNWISLAHNKLTSIPAGMFSGLSKLTYVRLDYNSISSVASGVFTNSYDCLSLDHNRLAGLSFLSSVETGSDIFADYNYCNILKSTYAARKLVTALSNDGVTVTYKPQYTTITAVDSAGKAVANKGYTNKKMTVSVLNGTTSISATRSGYKLKIANGKNVFSKAGVYTVKSACGANKTSFTAVIDQTRPSVWAAVKSGKTTTKSVRVHYYDKYYASKSVTSYGAAYAWPSGSLFTREGKYKVTVADKAGNKTSYSFNIEKSGPTYAARNAAGRKIAKGGSSNSDVTVLVQDVSLKTKKASLNGKSIGWPSKNNFTKTGTYVITASDAKKHTTTFTFAIDRTAPQITVTDLAGRILKNGDTVSGGAGIACGDADVSAKILARNGVKTVWADTVSAAGIYTVTVTDKAGNTSTFTFTIA